MLFENLIEVVGAIATGHDDFQAGLHAYFESDGAGGRALNEFVVEGASVECGGVGGDEFGCIVEHGGILYRCAMFSCYNRLWRLRHSLRSCLFCPCFMKHPKQNLQEFLTRPRSAGHPVSNRSAAESPVGTVLVFVLLFYIITFAVYYFYSPGPGERMQAVTQTQTAGSQEKL